MPVPNFPLGLALADTVQNNMLMIRLFENQPPADGFLDLNDIQQCTHPDIESSGPDDWHPADVVDEKLVFRKSKHVDFRTATAVPGMVAWGFYVTMLVGGVTKLMHYETFPAAKSLATVNANVVVQVELKVSNFG